MMSSDYPCIFNDSGTVARYDKLRHIALRVMESVCSLVCDLAAQVHLDVPARILDAGAGTGRFAIPIGQALAARKGAAELFATDFCQPMLDTIVERWPMCNSTVRLRCVQADLQEPLPPACKLSHVVFTIATFHILKKWREALDNLVNVLAPGGSFVFVRENNQFMHETEGFEKDSDFPTIDETLRDFMQFYHAQRASAGEPYQPRTLRYSDMMPAVRYLASLGLVEQPVEIPANSFEWQKPHTYADILHCFRQRQMTTWGSDLSEHAREKIADALDHWVADHGIVPGQEFFLPARLIPHVFWKPRYS